MVTSPWEEWDLWYPKAAANGLPFARGRLQTAQVLLVHAAPPQLTVTVRTADGELLAQGTDLVQTDDTPMTRLTRNGERIERVDIWPGAADLGRPVLLAGGEVGVLKQWWHATDHAEWRWQIELYNHR
ncbi:MAG: hypothetical protein NVS4B6_31290 [Mycobacterium sp.]